MTKKEILEKIKSYNKSILLLRLEEKRNQLTTNFDEAYARTEAISNARDEENKIIRQQLLEYFKDYDIMIEDKNTKIIKHKEDFTIKELIEMVNNFKKQTIKRGE